MDVNQTKSYVSTWNTLLPIREQAAAMILSTIPKESIIPDKFNEEIIRTSSNDDHIVVRRKTFRHYFFVVNSIHSMNLR